MKKPFRYTIIAGILFLILLDMGNPRPVSPIHQHGQEGVPVSKAAELVHSVIEAGRTAYSQYIVERLHHDLSLSATESWKQDHTLLLPAQFLKLSAQVTANQGIGMRYRLSSLWPLNPDNKPKTEFEKSGLLEIVQHPDKPFTWIVQRGAVWYYQAIYPDKAVSPTCVSCHNNHPGSPKTDFKLGDVMGGMVIDIPLGSRFRKMPDESILIGPEVVTDYVHAVLAADRTVYSKYIVQRLEDRGVVVSKANWQEEKSLMLPAQFLLLVADIASRRKTGLNFSLISQWPINPHNGPSGEFERDALERLGIHPVRPYIGVSRAGGKRFFRAVYPDHAVTPACVSCHNAHPNSPKRDFKLGDVMGGVAVTLPLD